ncbi:MAG: hypothetical protein ACTS3F_00640 [Phycisphaerales bacterium]
MSEFADYSGVPAGIALNYGQALLAGIEPRSFGRMPQGIRMSPPAFIYGHLAIYPNRVLTMWEMDKDLPLDPATAERYTALFGAGVEAVHDPDGSLYPPMEQIVSAWKRGQEALIAASSRVPADLLARQNPIERMRERFPTIGVASSFLMNGHAMLHLGQVSAWRRAMGLGPAM